MYRLVEVAEVVVALSEVKLEIVEEALSTAPANFANATALICWRGVSVSNPEPDVADTSTLKKMLAFEKS